MDEGGAGDIGELFQDTDGKGEPESLLLQGPKEMLELLNGNTTFAVRFESRFMRTDGEEYPQPSHDAHDPYIFMNSPYWSGVTIVPSADILFAHSDSLIGSCGRSELWPIGMRRN